jgi:hypothetical protein
MGSNFSYQVRYKDNGLRVWFVPTQTVEEGFVRPFAEEPAAKDKWYSTSDIMAFTIPLKPDDQIHEEPRIIFGAGHWLQERYPDPEVQGGRIALIAFKQERVQKPPNLLDRMNSRYLKQVAYNDRVIEAEKEIAAINCEAPVFLAGSMAQRDNRLRERVFGSCTPRVQWPLSDAAIYPAGSRPSKCIIIIECSLRPLLL